MNTVAADTSPAPEPSSVLLYGATVLCLDAKGSVLRHCEMLVQRGVIASLGRSLTLMPGTRLIDITGHLVIPGLVETSTRFGLWPLGSDAERVESAHDDESAHALGLAAAVEALQAGVTTVQDVGLVAGSGGLHRALSESGLRVVAGSGHQTPSPRTSRKVGLAALQGAPEAISSLRSSTLGAAESLGLGAELGSLELGKWADLIVLSVDRAALEDGSEQAIYDLALSEQAAIRHVLIAGTSVLTDGRPARHDLEALRSRADAQRTALLARAAS